MDRRGLLAPFAEHRGRLMTTRLEPAAETKRGVAQYTGPKSRRPGGVRRVFVGKCAQFKLTKSLKILRNLRDKRSPFLWHPIPGAVSSLREGTRAGPSQSTARRRLVSSEGISSVYARSPQETGLAPFHGDIRLHRPSALGTPEERLGSTSGVDVMVPRSTCKDCNPKHDSGAPQPGQSADALPFCGEREGP